MRAPPLLNVAGVHEPWALRSIIEVETSDGRIGPGESYGDLQTLAKLQSIAPQLAGLDVFDTNALIRIVYASVDGNPDSPPVPRIEWIAHPSMIRIPAITCKTRSRISSSTSPPTCIAGARLSRSANWAA